MPFGKGNVPAHTYVEGEFIFGLNKAVNDFKEKNSSGVKPSKEARMSQPVNTVRQFQQVIGNITRFKEERFNQNYAYLNSLLNHEKYHTAVVSNKHNLHTKGTVGGEGSNESFRRKSKGALNFIISKGEYLHFVLDGLDMKDVVMKVNFQNKQDKSPQPTSSGVLKYRDVTGAELRWIYRHRNDPDTQECVQFWLDENPCNAPWDEPALKHYWTTYKPKSEQ